MQDFCDLVEKSSGRRVIITGKELLDLSRKFVQTMDATLFPRAIQGATSIQALRNSSCEIEGFCKVPFIKRHE